jgi:hypothetical protein
MWALVCRRYGNQVAAALIVSEPARGTASSRKSTSRTLQKATAGPASRGVIKPQLGIQALLFDAEGKKTQTVTTT